jgi:hypothetical protein
MSYGADIVDCVAPVPLLRRPILNRAKPVQLPVVQEDKMSGVIYSDNPDYQEAPQIFWRTTLWNTTELPVDNTIGAPATRRFFLAAAAAPRPSRCCRRSRGPGTE